MYCEDFDCGDSPDEALGVIKAGWTGESINWSGDMDSSLKSVLHLAKKTGEFAIFRQAKLFGVDSFMASFEDLLASGLGVSIQKRF